MFFLKTDMALRSEMNAMAVPVLSGFMTFMAGLVLAAGIGGARLSAGWDARLTRGMIIRLLPDIRARDPQKELDARLDMVKKLLAQTPGVKSHGEIGLAETKKLLEPWLGDLDGAKLGIPLPRVVSVELSDVVRLDMQRLNADLGGYSALVGIDGAGEWARGFNKALGASRLLLASMLALTLLALGATIAYAARVSIAENRRAIGVMRMVGAQNGYIAGMLSNQMAVSAFWGASAGAAASAGALFALAKFALSDIEGFRPDFSPLFWIAVLPLVAAGLAKAASCWFTLRDLKGMG
ncbi:MAG: hypothetical protein LBH41_02200 [Rickettsiales bacterium]|jgi:cell division transport system permease protein|nr:hypothetical protein [Rickettsiales bacterium]